MKTVHADSLAATLDAVNDAFFYGRPLSRREREQAAGCLARRQGLPGSYHDMFAPTEKDYTMNVKTFTGEPVRSGAGMRCKLSFEACRALILLDVQSSTVQRALERATRSALAALACERARGSQIGRYCCGSCSCAMWRMMATGQVESAPQVLAGAVDILKLRRDGKGRWKGHPFFYALLALSEMDPAVAREELRYAAPACQRLVERSSPGDKFARRRRVLAERVLQQA